MARIVTAFLIAAVAAGALSGPGLAASRQVGGNSYESPTYGYSLNWNVEFWTVANEGSEDGVDALVLQAGDGLITLSLTGLPSTLEPEECLDSVAAGRADDENRIGYQSLSGRDQPTSGPGAAGGVFGFTLQTSDGDQIPVIQYVECRPLVPGEALLAITLETIDDPEVYGAALVLYSEVIATLQVPGGIAQPDDGGDDDQDAQDDRDDEDEGERSAGSGRSGVDGNVYTSPSFGYTLTWDPAAWQVVEESTEDGFDSLQLGTTSGFSLVGFLASEEYAGDARQCRDDAGQILGETEGITAYTPTPNVNDGTPLIGGDAALAFAIYDATYTDEDGSFQARVYVQCRTLVAGRAVLAVIWIVPTVAFDTDLAAFEGLLAGVDTSGAEVRESGGSAGDDSAADRESDDEDQDQEDGDGREVEDEGDVDNNGDQADEDEESEDTDNSGGRNADEAGGNADD